MNEEFMNEVGGIGVAADWFKLARKYNPDGDLYLNETVILTNGGHTESEQATYQRHIKELLSLNAPIDGFGMQGHFNSEFTAPVRLLEILDSFAKFDRKLLITEFDMDNDDKRAQADYLRDFYTTCFSHPSVTGIIAWGFWKGDMWKPRGYLLDDDWSETPASKMYDDLVRGQWWTNEAGTSGAGGTFRTRAFKGIQTVTVTRGNYTWTSDVVVGDDGKRLTVIVP